MNQLFQRTTANCWRQTFQRTALPSQQLQCRFYSQQVASKSSSRQFTRNPLTPPPSKSEQELLSLGYIVRRTPSVELPIYKKTMSGGTKHVVLIKKVHGDKRKFLAELSEALSLDSGSIRINPTTQHIELKVWPYIAWLLPNLSRVYKTNTCSSTGRPLRQGEKLVARARLLESRQPTLLYHFHSLQKSSHVKLYSQRQS